MNAHGLNQVYLSSLSKSEHFIIHKIPACLYISGLTIFQFPTSFFYHFVCVICLLHWCLFHKIPGQFNKNINESLSIKPSYVWSWYWSATVLLDETAMPLVRHEPLWCRSAWATLENWDVIYYHRMIKNNEVLQGSEFDAQRYYFNTKKILWRRS